MPNTAEPNHYGYYILNYMPTNNAESVQYQYVGHDTSMLRLWCFNY